MPTNTFHTVFFSVLTTEFGLDARGSPTRSTHSCLVLSKHSELIVCGLSQSRHGELCFLLPLLVALLPGALYGLPVFHPVAQDFLSTITLWSLPADSDEVLCHVHCVDLAWLTWLVWKETNKFFILASLSEKLLREYVQANFWRLIN